MKKIILFLLAICALAAYSQECDFHPFCEDGKIWSMNKYHGLRVTDIYDYKMIGDTIIGNTHCKKVYRDNIYQGAVYEDGPKVFYFPKEHTSSHTLFDFGLNVGDKIDSSDFGGPTGIVLYVKYINEIEYNNQTYRHLRLEPEEQTGIASPEIYADWYEGLGSLRGPLASFGYNNVTGGLTSESLRICKVGNNILFFGETERQRTNSRMEAEDDGMPYELTPFCGDGKKWIVKDALLSSTILYEMKGDTIINDFTAHKMYKQDEYIGAFFDDVYKTYYIAPQTQKPILYYNLSLYNGDITRVSNGNQWVQLYGRIDGLPVVFEKKYLNNIILLYLEIENRPDSSYEFLNIKASQWIEGVGSLNGPMTNFILPDTQGPVDELLACWTPDEIIYDPKGLAAIHAVNYTQRTIPTYNLSGRKTDPNVQGIYIEGDKKVMR